MERSPALDLPKPVAAYFATEKAMDPDAQSVCFTADALVHDEDEDYRGRDAIRAWKQDANKKYQYQVQPIQSSVSGNTVTVLVRLSGNFPGSPVEVNHTFTLEDNKISSLVIE